MKPTTTIRITKTERKGKGNRKGRKGKGNGKGEGAADDVGQMAIHALTHIDTISRCGGTKGIIVSPKFDRVIRQ